MPLSSYQVSGMMSGQQQMFANYAAYAGQISPEGPPGMMGYGAPLGQQAPMGPGVASDFGAFNAGPRAIAGMHAAMPAMMGAGILAGSFLPGALGRGIGMLDPMQAALTGFGRASGLTSGIAHGAGMGEMFGGMATNLGRIGAGGLGNIARAGMVGIGGAAIAALPAFIGMKAVEYGGGQMVEGAQFTNQVQRTLGQNFRFTNPLSQTGYGFSREQGAEIAGTIRQMGNREIMSSPQEMLRIMEQGVQGGLFRPVQDAKAFQAKFKEMVGALKEVAKTFNTTLEGAMPFLQEGRRMGFWTPSDVMRMAASTRATAATTGMTVAQVQQMQEQGAGMARSVGAQGAMGALGMQRTMDVVGGGLRSGVISEQRMAELTGGLQGSEAIAALSGTLQAGTTRFAASRTARWLLAATANKSMTGLDDGKLGMLASGRLGIDQIRGMAEKGVQGRGAEFVMGEENMRGDLLKRGPEAQAGFISGIAGKRLYGDSAMDKLVTRRLVQRYFGGDARQADSMAELARHMPEIMRDNSRRAEASADTQARQHEEMMEHSYEGLKKKVSDWTKKFVEEPLQKASSDFSQGIGDTWEKMTDKIWGRAPRGLRLGGLDRVMSDALRSSSLGNASAASHAFTSSGEMDKKYGAGSSTQDRLTSVQKNIEESIQGVASSLSVTTQQSGSGSALWRALSGAPSGAANMLPVAQSGKQTQSSSGLMQLMTGDRSELYKSALLDFTAGDTKGGVAKLNAAADAAEKAGDGGKAKLLRDLAKTPGAHKSLADLGSKLKDWYAISGTDVVERRMHSAKDALSEGGQFEDRIKRLNEFTGKDSKSAGIGSIIRDIVTKGANKQLDQVQYQDQLKRLSQASEGLSPEQAAGLQSILAGPGMESLGVFGETIGGAGDVGALSKAWKGHGGTGAKVRELNRLTDKLGLAGISSDEIGALQNKKPGKKQLSILEGLSKKAEGLDPEMKGKWQELLGAVKSGDTETLGKIGHEAEAIVHGRHSSDPSVDKLSAQKKSNETNIIGKLGSTEGMHSELTRIRTAVEKTTTTAGTGNPQTFMEGMNHSLHTLVNLMTGQ